MLFDATKVQVNATKVQVDATKVQVDATKVQVDATKVQVDATKVQVDATKVQVDATKCKSRDLCVRCSLLSEAVGKGMLRAFAKDAIYRNSYKNYRCCQI
ncbi:MAG: hypothetical protein RMX96_32655 [Nostoc sp. ChiSLP02]|nr:hypothetical protein [Nostoc sp. DedSLP05]MDZ8189576.1 hypothetical protein [Nostoc sp. ChiSLP02]